MGDQYYSDTEEWGILHKNLRGGSKQMKKTKEEIMAGMKEGGRNNG